MPAAIETQKLTRRFGDFIAVDALDLSISKGEIFGLLGPNAAGKSTTIRMLAGILQPSSGGANILGLDLITQTELIKRRIGYVAQQFALYPDLSVMENMTFYAGLYSVHDRARISELVSLYGLANFVNRRAGLLSGGYKRRLAMACATAHDPELIFLDEPTAGIDPVTRKELWDLFYNLATAGKTLFVTTHYMEEAERCHKLSFLSNGKRVAEGTPASIRALLDDRYVYTSEIQHNPELSRALLNTPGVKLINQFGNELRMVTETSVTAGQLQKIIGKYDVEQCRVALVSPSIEDAFITLTSSESEQ